MANQKTAPRFLNLFLIKLPPGGIASIGHRISGVLMFLTVPFLSYLLSMSIQSSDDYARVLDILTSVPVAIVSIVIVWALSHHLFAGIRHLFIDIEIGINRDQARVSAWIVNIAALLVTALWLVRLL